MGGGSHPWGLQLWQHPSRVNTCGLAKGESEGPRVSITPTASLLVLWVLLCVPHFLCKVGGKVDRAEQGESGLGGGTADLPIRPVFPPLPRQSGQCQGLGQGHLGPASGISTPDSPSVSLTT